MGKIVFFGTSEFAIPALRAIASEVSLVVTQPDRPGRRGMKLQPSPVKQAAEELGLPVETPEKSRAPEAAQRLQEEHADMLVVAAYGQILSQRMLDAARLGGFNLHGSILPYYRGAAPIQRCLMAGEQVTGVTLMQMNRGMDTGDMIDIGRLDIEPEETYGELQARLAVLGADMISSWLPRLYDLDYPRIVQDSDAATLAPKIEKWEAELDFSRKAQAEYSRYRAVSPSPGAFVRTRFGSLRVMRASCGPATDSAPGFVVATTPKLLVAFEDGSIGFDELRPEGKKQMRGTDFANGARLRPGDGLL